MKASDVSNAGLKPSDDGKQILVPVPTSIL